MSEMTKKNTAFEQWYERLQEIADEESISVADVESWREEYDAGKTPEGAFNDEWGGE